ncbi:MAG: hypothetical protein CL760_09720 [Chloroflexi bacterium]|nr:hypothetical protein [Chloroflexota bacterium]|tara:strand:+ start:10897 stop:11505 length:609 start_codon:yes stop_codon:yes gene_type:complete
MLKKITLGLAVIAASLTANASDITTTVVKNDNLTIEHTFTPAVSAFGVPFGVKYDVTEENPNVRSIVSKGNNNLIQLSVDKNPYFKTAYVNTNQNQMPYEVSATSTIFESVKKASEAFNNVAMVLSDKYEIVKDVTKKENSNGTFYYLSEHKKDTVSILLKMQEYEKLINGRKSTYYKIIINYTDSKYKSNKMQSDPLFNIL